MVLCSGYLSWNHHRRADSVIKAVLIFFAATFSVFISLISIKDCLRDPVGLIGSVLRFPRLAQFRMRFAMRKRCFPPVYTLYIRSLAHACGLVRIERFIFCDALASVPGCCAVVEHQPMLPLSHSIEYCSLIAPVRFVQNQRRAMAAMLALLSMSLVFHRSLLLCNSVAATYRGTGFFSQGCGMVGRCSEHCLSMFSVCASQISPLYNQTRVFTRPEPPPNLRFSLPKCDKSSAMPHHRHLPFNCVCLL